MQLKIDVTLKPGPGGPGKAPDMLMKVAFPEIPIEVEFNAEIVVIGDEDGIRIFNFTVGGTLYGQFLDHPDPNATVDHLESLPSVTQGLFLMFMEMAGGIFDDLEAKQLELDHPVIARTEMEIEEPRATQIVDELRRIKTSGKLSTM